MSDSETLHSIQLKELAEHKEVIDNLYSDDSNCEEDAEKKDDLNLLAINTISSMNLKIAIILIFVYIILNSEAFIENILSKFSGALESSKLTNKGVFILSLFLAFSYILLDIIF